MNNVKSLDGWQVDGRGHFQNGIYSVHHFQEYTSDGCESVVHCLTAEGSRVIQRLHCKNALIKNLSEVERRISTEEDVIINGYHFYMVDDDAYYVGRTPGDVLEFCRTYGPIVDIYGVSEEEFLKELIHINLCAADIYKKQTFKNDDSGKRERKSYYDYYREAASKDKGCQPVLWFNV